MILPRAYGFIFSRVLVFFPFLWAPKIQGAALLITRARIGVEIIYPSSVFVGHGVNRLKLRCKRISLIGYG